MFGYRWKKPDTQVKTIGLRNKVMQKISTYYGLAILRNPKTITDMRKAIWATYYHKISDDNNSQHKFCPEGAD